jgi:hypothetical protein
MPEDRSVKPSSEFTLQCVTNDEENTRIVWRFKDKQLVKSIRHKQEGSQLVVKEVNEKDAGEYECEATNLKTDQVLKAKAEILVRGELI